MQHLVPDLFGGALDGAGKAEHVRRPVALHYNASEPQQGRSIEAARIEAPAKRVEDRYHHDACEPGERAAHELLADEAAHHLRDPLRSFEHDVADEAIAHYHVGLALVDPV